MATIVSILSLGFFLGMRHATDADHVVAVTTIISRERSIRRAAAIGIFWGIGHTLTLLVAGGAIILLGLIVPPKIGASLEFSVALMLIALGLWNLRSLKQGLQPKHASQLNISKTDGKGSGKTLQYLRSTAIGIVHGLAGSAAVALLVLPLVKDALLAGVYLLTFGIGTIAGMLLITTTISVPFSIASNKSAISGRYIALASSVLSIGFGLFLVYQIGFADGLFLP